MLFFESISHLKSRYLFTEHLLCSGRRDFGDFSVYKPSNQEPQPADWLGGSVLSFYIKLFAFYQAYICLYHRILSVCGIWPFSNSGILQDFCMKKNIEFWFTWAKYLICTVVYLQCIHSCPLPKRSSLFCCCSFKSFIYLARQKNSMNWEMEAGKGQRVGGQGAPHDPRQSRSD